MFQGWIAGPNKALIAFLYGNHLSLARGGQLYTMNATAKVFAISGPGAPVIRPATFADTNFLLAAVSGRKIKYAAKTIQVKGQRWPYHLRDPAVGPLSRSALHQGAVLRHGRRRPRQGHAEAGADPGGDTDADRRADAASGGAAAASVVVGPDRASRTTFARQTERLALRLDPLSGQPRKPILADLCAARWPSLSSFCARSMRRDRWRLRSDVAELSEVGADA